MSVIRQYGGFGEREVLEGEAVIGDYSLFKPILRNLSIHIATCRCIIELYEKRCTLQIFPQGWNLSRGFLHKLLILLEGSGKLLWGEAGDAQRPLSRINKPEKKGARSAAKAH